MNQIRILTLLAAGLYAFPASGDLIRYIHEGTGSGTLGGEPFANTGFVITSLADTDDVVSSPPFFSWTPHLESSIMIEGVGTFEITSPTTTQAIHLQTKFTPAASFGAVRDFGGTLEPGVVMAGPMDQVFATWDTTTPIGPITGPGVHEGWVFQSIETSEGMLIFDDEDITHTFTAEILSATLETDPGKLTSSLEQGQAETLPLVISNTGELPLEWQVENGKEADDRVYQPLRTAQQPRTAPTFALADPDKLSTGLGGGEAVAGHRFQAPRGDEVVLTHSNSLDIQTEVTLACSPDGGFTTRANRFLRTFSLADFAVSSDFDVSEVAFGIDSLTGDPVTVTVNLYELGGDFLYENMELIGTAKQEFEAQTLTLVNVPVNGTVPAGSTLVVEIAAPDLADVGGFFPGSNTQGESAPSYLAADDCGFLEPTPYSIISTDPVHLVMTVTGAGTVEQPDCSLPGWISVDPPGGSVPEGKNQTIEVTLDANDLEPGEFGANLCLASNDPERSIWPVPVLLSVEPAGAPELSITPPAIDFGAVAVDDTAGPETVALENAGTADLQIHAIESPALPFALAPDSGDCPEPPFALPPGDHCEIAVSFSPESEGNFEAAFNIESSAAAGTDSVSLSGTGAAPPPDEIFMDRFQSGSGRTQLW